MMILTRESGYEMEMDELSMLSFLPENCQQTDTLESFYEVVLQEEAHFKKLYDQAKANGTRLKVVASYEDEEGSFALVSKFAGKMWQTELGHSPLDVVVAWLIY